MNSVAMQDALLCALLSRPYAKFPTRRLNFKNRTNLRLNRASIDRDTGAQSMVCDDILSFLGLGEAFGGSEAWDDFGTFRSSLKRKVDLSNPEAWDEIDASLGGVDWYSHRGPAAPDYNRV